MAGASWRREQRPVLDLPRGPSEVVAELLALAGVIGTLVVLRRAWPDRVPTHFGPTGEPDAWGRKAWLLFPPLVMMVLYTALTILSRYPHIFNYPWRITAENAARQYRLARTMLSWLKAELVWLFAYLTWGTVRVAQGEAAGLGVAFLPVALLAIFGTLGVYFWVAARSR
ncbi:MAG: DUF1648 domain-containing protein [Sphaerobacter sp.]|nr:DUF1648 domain-containing protein [Sphaerobacter sp.]